LKNLREPALKLPRRWKMSESMSADAASVGLSVVPKKEKKVAGRKVSYEERMEAVRRVAEGQERVADVAKDMGLSTSAIHNWLREYIKALKDESENVRLNERVRELEGLLEEKEKELFKAHHEAEFERRCRSEIVQEIIKNR
jgi:transposase-like protein